MIIALVANTDWYLYNFRRTLAERLVSEGHEVWLLSPPGPWGARLRESGLRWSPMPMQRRSLNPIRELALLVWLVRFLRSHRIELVHGFTLKCVVLAGLAGRYVGCARIHAVAGLGYVFISSSLSARLLRQPLRAMLRLAMGGPRSRLIVQNGDDRSELLSARVLAGDRIHLIPGSGVDSEKFRPRASGAAPSGRPWQVLLVGRLLWDKGVGEFVGAARRLRQSHPGIECVLAGAPDSGNPAAVPATTIQGWAEEGVVRLLGHVEEMPALLAEVDCVVLPSYREGLPRSLLEAAACGLPMVATDVPGCRDVVVDGVTGLLVPARDGAALAEAIERLHASPELSARLGEGARARVLERFDERIVLDETVAVYREVASELESG